MAWFKKKEKKEKDEKPEELTAAAPADPQAPSDSKEKEPASNTETPATTPKVPATEKKRPTTGKSASDRSKKTDSAPAATSAASAKAPTEKKAVKQPSNVAETAPKETAGAPKAKAVAEKSASKKSPATKGTVKRTAMSVPAASTASPFFATTEEDIRIAFDEAIREAEYEILHHAGKAVGKYEFALEVDGYHFYLIANNGQILFDSQGFTSLIGALNGIKTFKKAVSEDKFEIKGDKYDRYRFILARKYYGENYSTREQCAKCVESVKNFASNAKVIRFTPDKDAIFAFEYAKNCKRRPDDIDWKAVAQAEENATKMGKFEICREDDDHYCFYLLANNGQILFASRYYANDAACRKGVDSFKRAAYVGNFFVDCDKFGNYRYVLKNIGSAPSFIGESYDNKPQCEKIIESVKKFIVTASIESEAETETVE